MESITEMVAVQVLELPLPSVAVKTAELAPILLQVKAFGVKTRLLTPHGSVEPLPTAAAVTEALPPASTHTLTF